MNDQEIFARLSAFQKDGIVSCLATIVTAAGSTPREIGAKMIICLDGSTYGSIGGGCGERQVQSAAICCLLKTKRPRLLEVDLTDDLATKGGDVCGGKMGVFIEPFSVPVKD